MIIGTITGGITLNPIILGAFSEFYNYYRKGRGNIYIIDTTLQSSLVGFITGVISWFFHKGVV